MLKLDIFPHIFPLAYFERMKRIAEGNPALAAQLKRWMHIPVLWDLDKRIRMMQRFPGYKQILTLSMPAIEFLGGPDETPALARLANDGMAQIVHQHPDLFPAFLGKRDIAGPRKTIFGGQDCGAMPDQEDASA